MDMQMTMGMGVAFGAMALRLAAVQIPYRHAPNWRAQLRLAERERATFRARQKAEI